MNERIRELKRQAMLFAQEKCEGQTTDMHGNLRSNIWTEKFAELIVQECALQCNEALVPHTGQPSMTHNYAVGLCQDKIREHFGVEE